MSIVAYPRLGETPSCVHDRPEQQVVRSLVAMMSPCAKSQQIQTLESGGWSKSFPKERLEVRREAVSRGHHAQRHSSMAVRTVHSDGAVDGLTGRV